MSAAIPIKPQTNQQKENALLAGRYEVLSYIGSGVTSKVYKAIDRKLNTTVAVKMLNPYLATDPISIERFKREAHITRVLMHPQIATITDIFKYQGQIFLIMNYAEGISLKEFIHLNAPLKIEIAVSIVEQLLSIMQACHAKNIIHRDIKPQNIVIDENSRVKLLDFGIARMTSLSDLTQTGTSLGTPEYMAPELFATNTYDPRTDLYAIGVIAYEMLTSILPFQGDTIAVLYTHHLQGEIAAPKSVRRDLPFWLSDLVLHLLAKQSHQRYQTATEALQDIKSEKVLLKTIPNLKEMRCLSCGESTFSEVSICTNCGADRNSLFLAGGTSLRATENTDNKKLASFLSRTCKISGEKIKIRKNQLIVSNISAQTSAMLKMLAMREGIYLQNTDNPIDPRIKFYVLAIPVVLLLLGNFSSFRIFNIMGFIGVFSWTAILGYLLNGIKRNTPIITAGEANTSDIKLQIPTTIKRVFSNKELSIELRALMKQLVKKHVLIINAEKENSMQLAQLGELTKTAAEIAEQMGEMQKEMNAFDPRVAMEMLDDAQEHIKEARSEAEKLDKEGIYFAILQSLQFYQHQEELLSKLNNKLIQINATFNQVTAQTCVLNLPIDNATTELLTRLNEDLKQQHDPTALTDESEVS